LKSRSRLNQELTADLQWRTDETEKLRADMMQVDSSDAHMCAI